MSDFLLFEAPIGGLSVSATPTPNKVSEALALRRISVVSRELAFLFAPIKRGEIRDLAKAANAATVAELSSALSQVSPGRLEGELSKCCDEVARKSKYGEEERVRPLSFAWSYYFNEMLKFVFQPGPEETIPLVERPARGWIKLAASMHGWQAVKKTALEKASQGEVLACLAGIAASSERKSVEWLLGKDFASLEAMVANATKGSRKSFSNIPASLSNYPAAQRELVRLVGPEHLKIVEEYYVRALFEGFGYPARITPLQVAEVWPEFKVPAMRGRKPKG